MFVFGSNELGIHGRGAAKTALDTYEARQGQGFGPQGLSFAIPTCSKPAYGNHEISFKKLKYYIECFIMYAEGSPNTKFFVTRIGCGLAGWKDEEVAPLFSKSPSNCYFDAAWNKLLPGHNFWGTFEGK